MLWLKLLSVSGLSFGAWSSFRAMGAPIRFEGRRYYRQAHGRYRRWYGGRLFNPDEIGL
jgi:hypothetical protein